MPSRDEIATTEGQILGNLTSKILVVDDVPENLRLLKIVLKSQGYDVRFAPSGQFALTSLSRFIPDLILLDVMMPEMNGYDLCQQLKSNPSTKDIPVIFLSALSEGAEKVKGFQVGAVDYITKPFEAEEVLARVAHHLKLTHLSRQLQAQNQALIEQNEQLQKAERETRLLLQVTEHLTQASTWPEAIAQVLMLVCNYILWDYGEAWLPTAGDGQALAQIPTAFAQHPQFGRFHQESHQYQFQQGAGLPGRIWVTQQPEWIEDCSQLETGTGSYYRQALAAAAGLKAAFGLPIVVENQVVAVLIFYQTQKSVCQLHVVALVQAIASQLALFIQRKQGELKLQQQAQNLERALHQLQTTQTQLIQSEKMSSLGQLVAGLSHEINNPVSFISGNIDHLENYIQDLIEIVYSYQQHYPHPPATIRELISDREIDFILTDIPNVILSMRSGTERITKIINSLRRFSHLNESQLKTVDIHDEIESVLTILQNRIKLTDPHSANASNLPPIHLQRNYTPVPKIQCFPAELNQALMQIIVNAIDALQ